MPLLQEKNILDGHGNINEVKLAIDILNGSGADTNKLTALHCNTEYPTPFSDVNLNAMITIRDKLNIKVGYSDHTKGIEIPIAATAMGQRLLKSILLWIKMNGPDHLASMEPEELFLMVKSIRNIEKAMEAV